MTDREQLLGTMAAAAMNAILDSCRADDGMSYLDPALVRQSLVACLASVIEADPTSRGRKEMRDASELVARELRMQMFAVRAHFEATGERGWDATAIPLQ